MKKIGLSTSLFLFFTFTLANINCNIREENDVDLINRMKTSLEKNNLADFNNLSSNIKTRFENGRLKNLLLNQVLQIPYEVYQFGELDTLFLERDNISFVSDSLFNLKHLKYLSLSGNPLNKLPSFSNYPSLEKLDLSFCKLSGDITIEIPNSLSSLEISSNLIKNLEIKGGRNLKSLSLINNLMKNIPPSIYLQSKTEHLSIFMETLEDTIDINKLPMLKYLEVRSRNLSNYGIHAAIARGIDLDTTLNTPIGPKY